MEKCDLTKYEIGRYARQLILPNFGPAGQEALSKARVLIVGCGGLGCPAAIYLAGAGVGTLGVVDNDVVEVSNLHRQILHKEERIGVSKALSLASECERLNSLVKLNVYPLQLNSSNALKIVEKYDLVLDCSDNVPTRYLVNDACVLLNKPLVSGSALRSEGQLTVYHHASGPCYRCLFPRPAPAHLVSNCAEGGVLGPVPGLMGVLQAMEAMKIVTTGETTLSGAFLVFDGDCGEFMTFRLQNRNAECAVCGDTPTITQLIDYEAFCNSSADDKDGGLAVLSSSERISVQDYKAMMEEQKPHILVDVRPKHEFDICRLPDSVNIPLSQLSADSLGETDWDPKSRPAVLLCRRGNDSQLAVRKLQELYKDSDAVFKDVIGGLHQWANAIDDSFPVY